MDPNLRDAIDRLGRPRVLVVGDVILDRYVFGSAERISQEAPVPILRADQREERLGGAASVASMLARLGADVTLAGVLGDDDQVPRVRRLLGSFGLRDDCLVADAERPTTLKERYIGRAQDRHPQQILRVDFEVRTPLSAELESRMCDRVNGVLGGCDIILVSDYGKGVCTPTVLRHLVANAGGRRVVVDPIRGTDYAHYEGVSCLTPNRTEVQLATGLSAANPALALDAGEQLRRRLGAEAVVVTLDKEGMVLAHRDGRRQVFPTRPRQVYDITGAGDMVLSVLGLALAAGLDYDTAIILGNVAGGLEVEQMGVVTLTRDDLIRDLARMPAVRAGKILPLSELLSDLEAARHKGEQIVFTNGCFDVLHAGHVRYLNQARALGQKLVVGLNSDASVRRLKGPSRPLNDARARAEVLAALGCVDYVVVFAEDTPQALIEAVRPHVLVKGADYRPEEVIGRDFVEAQGGRLVLLPLVAGQSSSRLIPFLTPKADAAADPSAKARNQ